MKTSVIISIIASATLFGCSNAATSISNQKEQSYICQNTALAGGWSASDVTPEAKQAIALVIEKMGDDAELKRIDLVRIQIVSGMNYAVQFTLKNGEQWHAIVYRNLSNEYSIVEPAKLGILCQ